MEDIFINLDDISISTDSPVALDAGVNINEEDTLVGPPGPPGPPGRDGVDGVDGQSATVTVGETTTTAPGTDAIVTNVGDNLNAVLNFSIPRGAVGETGPAGADGVDGSDGFSPIATVTQTEYGADISITDSQGTTTAQVVNGSAGAPGQAATVTVGSTTTGNPGTNASVTNSGTTSAAVLEFTIPRGATGDTGPAGQDGRDGVDGSAATIAVGTTTTGNPGTAASVTNSGTSSAAVFNFTIPRGDTGAAGADGNDGAAATIAVGNVSTGAAGSSASVTNTGTSSAAVFDFVIPRGDTGAAGADGADGYSPTATVTQGTGSATISITDQGGTTTATVYDGAPGASSFSELTGKATTSQINWSTLSVTHVSLTRDTNNVSTINRSYLYKREDGFVYGTIVFTTSANTAAQTEKPMIYGLPTPYGNVDLDFIGVATNLNGNAYRFRLGGGGTTLSCSYNYNALPTGTSIAVSLAYQSII